MTLPLNDPVAIFLVIMAVILLAPLIFERFHLPGIVGVILVGMLVGPNVTNLLGLDSRIDFLSTIGLVYLMFNAGLEVDIHSVQPGGLAGCRLRRADFSLPDGHWAWVWAFCWGWVGWGRSCSARPFPRTP